MTLTSHPLLRRCACMAGSNWRNLAAAALLRTTRHQVWPSMGPACSAGRSAGGIRFHRPEPFARFPRERRQFRQHGRFVGGLLQSDGVVAAVHGCLGTTGNQECS